MKYTDALCEQDFRIIQQLNKFTDPDTFTESVNKLINNSNSKTAERLRTLYPIRLKELGRYSYCTKIDREFSDCTIHLTEESSNDTAPQKNYLVYGEEIINKGEERNLFYNIYTITSKRNAFFRESEFKSSQINEDCTKMKVVRSSPRFLEENYYRIRELQEGIVDFNQLADKYFEETGKKLLNNDISLTMKVTYDTVHRYFITTMYENGKNIGSTWNLYILRISPQHIAEKTFTILYWYYIGFTPEQIENKFSHKLL